MSDKESLCAGICSLARGKEYKVMRVHPEPVTFNKYKVTVQDSATERVFNIIMPDYVVRYARPNLPFRYHGIKEKLNKPGYFYHNVEWPLDVCGKY